MVEHTVAMLLAIYKRLGECDRSVPDGTWRRPITGFNTYEIAGKTVGGVGAGGRTSAPPCRPSPGNPTPVPRRATA